MAIGCPIHAAMTAWVYVFDHPYHAVTDERGRFRLPPVPPGQYTLHVRHPGGGMRKEQDVVVPAGESVRLRAEFHGDDLKAKHRSGKASWLDPVGSPCDPTVVGSRHGRRGLGEERREPRSAKVTRG